MCTFVKVLRLFTKVHMKNSFHFVANEVLNNAIGYLAGFIASNLVARFFVKKGIANLWGLTAHREAVNKTTYEWLMFFSAYFIGLIVLLLVNRLMKKLNPTPKAE